MDTRLVILAGGLGSRFGGDKAFTRFGPRGELLLEFTLFDARRAGVELAVLVVPPGSAEALAAELESRVVGVELRFVEQDRARPYADLETPARERPWGTAHAAAIGCDDAADCCVVVNADDWYGPRALTDLVGAGLAGSDAALATWPLASTLSEHGPVNRGLCEVEDGWLVSIRECVGIEGARGQLDGEVVSLDHDTPISLNCWALGRRAIDWLKTTTRAFIEAAGEDPRVEAQLPTLLMAGIEQAGLRIRAVPVGQAWAGVTFRADAEAVRARLRSATCYPSPLWSKPSS